MASRRNRHCAKCIGTLAFAVGVCSAEFLNGSYLHVELDHVDELLELGDLVDLPVRLLQVEPAAANIAQVRANSSPQSRDPAVL